MRWFIGKLAQTSTKKVSSCLTQISSGSSSRSSKASTAQSQHGKSKQHLVRRTNNAEMVDNLLLSRIREIEEFYMQKERKLSNIISVCVMTIIIGIHSNNNNNNK